MPQGVPVRQFCDSVLQPPKLVPASTRQSPQVTAGGVSAKNCWMKLACADTRTLTPVPVAQLVPVL